MYNSRHTYKRRISHIQRVIIKAIKCQTHTRRGICIHVYMYIFIYVYMYICIHVYMYICLCVYIYIYMYIWVLAFVFMYIWIYVHTQIYMHICMYIYVYMYICIYESWHMYICICIYIYILCAYIYFVATRYGRFTCTLLTHAYRVGLNLLAEHVQTHMYAYTHFHGHGVCSASCLCVHTFERRDSEFPARNLREMLIGSHSKILLFVLSPFWLAFFNVHTHVYDSVGNLVMIRSVAMSKPAHHSFYVHDKPCSYVLYDSSTSVMWHIHTCDMTHSLLWHGSFIHAIWLILDSNTWWYGPWKRSL